MTWWLLRNMQHKYEMVVVFANTGREREETLDFTNKCDINFGFNTVWVEAVVLPENRKGTVHKIVTYETANRTGQPFEDVIAKYGMPNQNAPHCTRETKLSPIKSYMRSIGWDDYSTALGIRTDEPKRLDWEKAKEKNIIYFAQLMPVTKSDINKFWREQSFDLQLKSYEGNCDLCWKKGIRKIMTIVKDNPELANWWREMEEKYQNFTPESRMKNHKPPYRFFRHHMTIDDIIEESKFPFSPSKDESKSVATYKQMAMWDDYLDSNDGCSESCEVF
jgi:3'-phosphoadenosine 5'-phosphosulfate sulfotransferase (PAPS reductase)/FAD synthetase